MARPLRFEYPGAIYHVMARGDGGKFLFLEREDYLLFLKWLSLIEKPSSLLTKKGSHAFENVTMRGLPPILKCAFEWALGGAVEGIGEGGERRCFLFGISIF